LGCQPEELTPEIGDFSITPEPSATQQALAEPAGIDFGNVPLFGTDTAAFRIANESSLVLEIRAAPSVSSLVASEAAARLIVDNAVVTTFPLEIAPRGADGDEVVLLVDFAAVGGDLVASSARVTFPTNAGPDEDLVGEVRVEGVGLFIGDPNLQLQYNGVVFDLAPSGAGGDCAMADGVCTLPPLSFGNVSLSSSAQTLLTLRNAPAACRRSTTARPTAGPPAS
jgi:hypothetical protein